MQRTRMPFAVDLAHIGVFLFIAALMLVFYLLGAARSPGFLTVIISTAGTFVPVSLLFAVFPFNVFNGAGSGGPSLARPLRPADLDEVQRRLLFECYRPANRRR